MSFPYEPAAIPSNEAERLMVLRNYEILDTSSQEIFDDYTWLASRICDVPTALISLVDKNRQWFKSRVGLDVLETPRNVSFCAHAIHHSRVMEVPDTLEDQRFCQNPLVTGEPYIRFYAGAPLTSMEGYHVGTLCVIDQKPRQLSTYQKDALIRLSRQIVKQMEVQQMFKERRREESFLEHISRSMAELASGTISPQFLQKLVNKISEILPEVFVALHFNTSETEQVMVHAGPTFHSENFYRKQALHVTHEYRQSKNIGRIRFEPPYTPLFIEVTDTVLGVLSLAAANQRQLEKAEEFLRPLMNSLSSLLMSYKKSLSKRQSFLHQNQQLQALQSLNQIASLPDLNLKTQLQHALILGCEHFNVDLGIIYEQPASAAPDATETPKRSIFLEYTHAPKARPMLDVTQHAELKQFLQSQESPQELKVIYSEQGPTYLKAPLDIDDIVGSLYFACYAAPPQPFSEVDIEFFRLFSRWTASTWSRYNYEQQHKKNEEILEKTGAIAQVGGWEINLEDNIPIWTAQTRAIHEVPDDYVPNLEEAIQFYAPEARPIITALVEKAIEDGTPWDVELPFITAKNNAIWVRSAGETETRAGKVVRLFGVFQNITTRKNNERIKEEFISTMNHELRTPLTSIAGALSMLHSQLKPQSTPTIERLFNIAQKNTSRLTELINDLLDIEKIAAGAMRFQPRLLEVNHVTEEAIRHQELFAAAFNSRYLFKGTRQPIYIHVDPLRLSQILNNLLSNAAKFSPPESLLEIEIQSVTIKNQLYVCLRISNPGPGIPPAFHKQVFKRFMQVDSSDKRSQGGTGLGLAISKELTEAMQGRIHFESGNNLTTFSVYFPQVDPPALPDRELKYNENQQLHYKTRILFIEDDADFAAIVSEHCHDLAHFSFASTLTSANEALDESIFDLVLLDVLLPDGSGLKLLPKIRSLAIPPEIVVLSAVELNAAQQKLVDESLVKSRYTPEDFVHWLKGKLSAPPKKED